MNWTKLIHLKKSALIGEEFLQLLKPIQTNKDLVNPRYNIDS